MKQGFKLLTVLLMTLLLTLSATAQINWLKQDGGINYLAWDDGSISKTISYGNSATFTTGYFGSTASQKVKLTATINSKTDGKIVSTIFSEEVNVANNLGYKIITVLPEHYQNKAGEYIIVIKLKDANSELVDTSLYLKVNQMIIQIPPDLFINHAPVMNNIANKQVIENKNVQFTVSATDAENDDLTFEARACLKIGNYCWGVSPNYFGASFNTNTGVFSFTPSYEFVKHPALSRVIDLGFRADDGNKKSAWEYATITVKDVNRKPQLAQPVNKIVQEEQLLQFTIYASDADNDDLTYSILGSLPPGAAFDAATQKFKWITNNTQAGLYSVTFKVMDMFGGEDLKGVLIKVIDVPVEEPQCNDGIDNDSDGVIDENDPGCHTDNNPNNPNTYDPNDNDEIDLPVDLPECKDSIDNDNDGKIDFPNDLGCSDENDDDESDDPVDNPECRDELDNDNDGEIDFPNDPGCSDEQDDDESDDPVDVPECRDGIDNDGDGKVDFPNDLGCTSPVDDNERDDPVDEPQCSDGIDNDNDSLIDLYDSGCDNPEDDDESNSNEEPVPPKPALYTNIKFKAAHLEDMFAYAGELMAVHVHILNNGKTDLKDVEIQAVVYELGAFGSTSDFTLLKNDGASKTIFVPVPEQAQPGWYLVKITAKNYHYHTSTYRLVYIGSNTFQ